MSTPTATKQFVVTTESIASTPITIAIPEQSGPYGGPGITLFAQKLGNTIFGISWKGTIPNGPSTAPNVTGTDRARFAASTLSDLNNTADIIAAMFGFNVDTSLYTQHRLLEQNGLTGSVNGYDIQYNIASNFSVINIMGGNPMSNSYELDGFYAQPTSDVDEVIFFTITGPTPGQANCAFCKRKGNRYFDFWAAGTQLYHIDTNSLSEPMLTRLCTAMGGITPVSIGVTAAIGFNAWALTGAPGTNVVNATSYASGFTLTEIFT